MIAAALGAALALSACSGSDPAHIKAWDFDDAAAGREDGVLAGWAPDTATDIHILQRTTGEERIVTMTADIVDLPAECTPVSEENPLEPRPERRGSDPADYRTASTITASWWQAGQEQDATMTCGKWWVGQDGTDLWAFTPELQAVTVEEQTS